MTRKWRMREVFRGPVQFGASGNDDSRDVNFYTATAASNIRIDVSADIAFFDGVDLWMKDDDNLIFGDSNDFSIDWSTADGLMFLPVAANNDLTFGSSTLYPDADWNLGVVDVDVYGTAGGIDVNRNLTSGVTSTPVLKITQDNTSDDQVALHIVQDATAAAVLVAPTSTGVALDINGGVDIDGVSTFTSGALVDIQRNLTSGNTDDVVLYVKQDNASDDQIAAKVEQDGNALALDVVGFTDLGYVTTEPTNTTVGVGGIRSYFTGTNYYLGIQTNTGGTFMYMAFDLTTGGLT